MATIKVDVDGRALVSALRLVPNQLAGELKNALERILIRIETGFVSSRLSGRPGLFRQSGNLARSWVRTVRGQRLDDLEANFGTRVKYAPIHEFGGIIRPTKAKYLAIPLDNAKVRGIAASPRDFPGGFFLRSKAGNLLFGVGRGDGGFEPLFVLKREVRIPARMGLIDYWQSQRGMISTELNRGISRALDRGFGGGQ